MAKDISAMADDLEAVMAQNIDDAVSSAQSTAEDMAKQVAALSTPEYGVMIRARTVPVRDGKEVQVLIGSTSGPGTVFGGRPAAAAAVERTMDRVAREGGLDRRR
jgi:hypothetical protein